MPGGTCWCVWPPRVVFGIAADGVRIVRAKRTKWWWCRWPEVAEEGGGAAGSVRRRVAALGGVCGLSGPPLVILKTQVDGFFRYEANGMGSETQKHDLRVRLGVFQISKSLDRFGGLALISGGCGAVGELGLMGN